jgi:hypothetical protein
MNWLRGPLQLVCIRPEGGNADARSFGLDYDAAARWAYERNASGANVYFTVNETAPGLDRKPRKADIARPRAFHVDVDDRSLLPALRLYAPSVILDSGGGYQGIWYLAGDADAIDVEDINRRIAHAIGADLGCFNIDRLLRYPGPMNWPNAAKRARGRVPVASSLLQADNGSSWSLDAMRAMVPPAPDVAAREARGRVELGEWREMRADKVTPPLSAPTIALFMSPCEAGQDRSQRTALAAVQAAKEGVPNETIMGLLMCPDNAGAHAHIAAQARAVYAAERAVALADRARLPSPEAVFGAVPAVLPDGVMPGMPDPALVPPRPEGWAGNMLHERAWDKLVNDWAYDPSTHKVWPIGATRHADAISVEAFKMMFKPLGKVTMVGRSAAQAITALWEESPQRITLDRVGYWPDRSWPMASAKELNLCRLPVHEGIGGEIETWRAYLAHLLPDETERRWFEQWLGHKWAHPEVPGPGVVMVAHNVFGAGRGRLFAALTRLFGERNVQPLTFPEFVGHGSQGQYTDWADETLLVVIDEANDTGEPSWKAASGAYEAIKTRVDPASRKMRITRKGVVSGQATVHYSVLIATNNEAAIRVPAHDRRLGVLSNGDACPPGLSKAFDEWFRNDANLAAWARHLAAVDLAGYDPYAAPPMTDAKQDMAELGKSDFEMAVMEAIASMPRSVFIVDQVLQRLPPEMRNRRAQCERVVRDLYSAIKPNGKRYRMRVGGVPRQVYARTRQAWTQYGMREYEGIRMSLLQNNAVGSVPLLIE